MKCKLCFLELYTPNQGYKKMVKKLRGSYRVTM